MKHDNKYIKKMYDIYRIIKIILILFALIFAIICIFNFSLLIESRIIWFALLTIGILILMILFCNLFIGFLKNLLDISEDISNLYIKKSINEVKTMNEVEVMTDIKKEVEVKDFSRKRENLDLDIKVSTKSIEQVQKNVDSLEESLKKFKDRYK